MWSRGDAVALREIWHGRLEDLFLDLLIEPDGSHRWLEEDELEQALAAGLLTEEDAGAAREEGERVLAEWPFPTG